jgi:hypothetical protein
MNDTAQISSHFQDCPICSTFSLIKASVGFLDAAFLSVIVIAAYKTAFHSSVDRSTLSITYFIIVFQSFWFSGDKLQNYLISHEPIETLISEAGDLVSDTNLEVDGENWGL